MSSIAIITDTDSSLTADQAVTNGIQLVPINIQFGQETFADGFEIGSKELFERVDREGTLPTTSAPSPGQFAKAYEAAFAAGAQEVICFCVSSKISATFSAAVTACDLLPDQQVTVIDTNTLSMSQGFMVLEAAEAARSGATTEEIISRANRVGDNSHLFGALASLKYIAMSGRVGHLAAGFAGLLNIKPILGIQDGKLDVIDRVRTRKKAWARTIDLARLVIEGKQIERFTIMHVNAPDHVNLFSDQVRATLPYEAEIDIAELNPGLSVHTGTGLVGLTVVVAD